MVQAIFCMKKEAEEFVETKSYQDANEFQQKVSLKQRTTRMLSFKYVVTCSLTLLLFVHVITLQGPCNRFSLI
jgi:hypothetical protein